MSKVFRIEKNKNYTVMSNYHFRDKNISLKAKGLLSQMLSLPEDWEYSINGLAVINKEGRDGINATLKELEMNGYIVRNQLRSASGAFGNVEYVIYEESQNVAQVSDEVLNEIAIKNYKSYVMTALYNSFDTIGLSEQRERISTDKKKKLDSNQFNNFQSREYDMSNLEALLLGYKNNRGENKNE